jgi:hypothetical protein
MLIRPSKTRKIDAGTTEGEGKNAPVAVITWWASPSGRSAQIRGAVLCGKCSPGVSDTLGVQVRPVGVYVGNVVMLRLWWDEVDSSHSVAQFARCSRDS